MSFVFDMFDLGQPNLLLLAMMLYGFWLLQHGRPWFAGSMFALATAIKVFPVAVLPYLVWRRRWASAAGMGVFLVVFLLLIPAPIRGYERNVNELKTWFNAMVGSSSEKGFGQRDEQNWSWVNQSIIAVTHRLVRPINYNQNEPALPARTMNLIDVDFKTANWIVLGVALAIGLGFIAVIPPLSRLTQRSRGRRTCNPVLSNDDSVAAGAAVLFHVAVLPYHCLDAACSVRSEGWARAGATWALLATAGVLMLLSLPVFPTLFQAIGNNLAATALIVAGLIWHMRHPPVDAICDKEVAGIVHIPVDACSVSRRGETPAPEMSEMLISLLTLLSKREMSTGSAIAKSRIIQNKPLMRDQSDEGRRQKDRHSQPTRASQASKIAARAQASCHSDVTRLPLIPHHLDYDSASRIVCASYFSASLSESKD